MPTLPDVKKGHGWSTDPVDKGGQEEPDLNDEYDLYFDEYEADPAVHHQELGEDGERVTVVSEPVGELQDSVLHLVQDEQTISELHSYVMPPDEYYEELAKKWALWWPKADPALLEHLMSVLIAFDTATCFAMSFGIAKFALAQCQAKLV